MRKQPHMWGKNNPAKRAALASSRTGWRRRTWSWAGAAAAVVLGLTAWAVTGAVAGSHGPPGAAAAAGQLTAEQGGSGSAADGANLPVMAGPTRRSLPGALAVAVPQTNAGSMQTDLMVRVVKWKGGQATCASVPHSLPDAQSGQAVTGACGAVPELTSAAPPGYGAVQLRAYLHLTATGAGQSVAIVDAFDNPYATRDITAYSKQFGLPLPCTKTSTAQSGCFHFTVVHPYGFAGASASWALESDLDTQMVHAIAPQASITLVEAYNASLPGVDLDQAIDYAAALKPAPAAISNSYSTPEFAGESVGDQHCGLARSLCVFSAGDSGNPGGYPAYSPYVLAVGGTTLELGPDGRPGLEAGWCCGSAYNRGAGGGGVSQYESRPAYQDGVNPYQGRGIPDVSFDADPETGVAVYDTFGLDGQNGWFEVGGTSVGTPAWSGIVAAADQLRAAFGQVPLHGAGFQAQQLIYSMAHQFGFADITQGANNFDQCNAALGTPAQACQATRGYDLVTGWGSPRPGIDSALALARAR
jgi:hypothetical protein